MERAWGSTIFGMGSLCCSRPRATCTTLQKAPHLQICRKTSHVRREQLSKGGGFWIYCAEGRDIMKKWQLKQRPLPPPLVVRVFFWRELPSLMYKRWLSTTSLFVRWAPPVPFSWNVGGRTEAAMKGSKSLSKRGRISSIASLSVCGVWTLCITFFIFACAKDLP